MVASFLVLVRVFSWRENRRRTNRAFAATRVLHCLLRLDEGIRLAQPAALEKRCVRVSQCPARRARARSSRVDCASPWMNSAPSSTGTGKPGHAARPAAPADAIARLEHQHRAPGARERVGCREAGRTGPDHQHIVLRGSYSGFTPVCGDRLLPQLHFAADLVAEGVGRAALGRHARRSAAARRCPWT
jgi:hypothetical protein